MLRRTIFSLFLALLLGVSGGCFVGEDCSTRSYFRAFDLAAFCSTSTACTPGGQGTAEEAAGDDPEWFEAFGGYSPVVIDLTALDDVIRTKPFLGFARYTSAGVVPNPTQVHFDGGAPCLPLSDLPPDGQDFACAIPRGAMTLTVSAGQTSESFTMYLFGIEVGVQVICAL